MNMGASAGYFILFIVSRKIVPLMKQNAIVAVASFADTEEDCIASGISLIRKYLEVAFGENSQDFIAGMMIASLRA